MFRLEIETSNDAFQGDPQVELARIITGVASRLAMGDLSGTVRDVNGNTVGQFQYQED